VKFRIHFEVKGEPDSIVLEAPSIEEIRDLANEELEKRGAVAAWSEKLKGK
jgi:hypothetical protein